MQATEALREIDLATAAAFLVAVCEMIDGAENRAVVIDCSAIGFVDSSGYHALMAAHDYAVSQDHSLVLHGLAPNCARMLRICDPDEVLTIAPFN